MTHFIRHLSAFALTLSLVVVSGLILFTPLSPSYAGFSVCGVCNGACDLGNINCDTGCTTTSETQTEITNQWLDQRFTMHRNWMVNVLFAQTILPSMQRMAEQLTAASMHQILAIGMLLDAKHQLETQRLFQQMMAQAHKDYHPSEGMCTFGTATRSLAASDRNMDLSAIGVSTRVLQRELLSGDAVAGNGRTSDYLSRIAQFREVYCARGDNGLGLGALCPDVPADPGRVNNDISYTNVLEGPLTLDLNFTPGGDVGFEDRGGLSPTEEDVLALASNLYAHKVAPAIPATFLSNEAGVPNTEGVTQYMDIRSIVAKRSVARNSFAAIAALKTQGEAEVAPYLGAIMKEMGMGQDDEAEIVAYLGERPSYYAQMEVLTEKLYQNPIFYTELIDKPANVDRKTVAMQAIELMQRRDMYRSILRSESILSVMLETALLEQQESVNNEINRLGMEGQSTVLPQAP